MEFGYFTLSDNHYLNNSRSANQFVEDILDETLYADELGFHSAWIGEHHFSSLGVLSCPDLTLAYVAARTKKIRLAPAVTVLPLHHPIRVAEQWASLDLLSGGRVDWAAGRGYDSREYSPFNISFAENQAIFNEGMEVVRKLWAGTGPVTHKGKYYSFEDMTITPQPVQKPIPAYVASFSKPSIELAARLNCGLVVAPFAAAMSYGGLKQVADLYKETCLAAGGKPGRLICSYFAHFADNKEQEQAQRARQIRYYKECVIPAFPSDPKTAPPSYRYLVEMTERLHKVKAEDLTENSVLLGSATDHRHAEESRSRRLRRGDPLFQCRAEAAPASERRDAALHGRGAAGVSVDHPHPNRHGRAWPGHPRVSRKDVDARDKPGHDRLREHGVSRISVSRPSRGLCRRRRRRRR
jgi:alkanesulfonate monooxygenase SsuD/methylene tetrahydromethanopterin reductase-like flavin-dependent oxidoreductase (luciferase family)